MLANIQLLGIPEAAKGVEFSSSMFRKPNVKALECILYHCCAAIKGKVHAKKVGGNACRARAALLEPPCAALTARMQCLAVLQGRMAVARQG